MTALSPHLLDRIHCGNCIDVLAGLPRHSVDLVITDPPYLARYRDRSGRTVANDNDAGDWLTPAFTEIHRVLKRDALCVSFYGWHRIDVFMAAWRAAGFRPVGHIVWTKGYSSNRRFLAYRHEQAYLLAKGDPALPAKPVPDVLPWTYSGNRSHPTEKAPEIFMPLIESLSKPGDVILDPFAGSGSTLVAALQLGRRTIGVELDANHAARANTRLRTVTSTRMQAA